MDKVRYYDPLEIEMLKEFTKEGQRLNKEERDQKIELINRSAPLDPKIVNMKSDLMITDFLTGRTHD